MCAHIYIYQWWIAEQRQYCIEWVTESWVLKAETRSALALCFSRVALQSFSLELRSLLSSWETGKSSKLIPAELRRLEQRSVSSGPEFEIKEESDSCITHQSFWSLRMNQLYLWAACFIGKLQSSLYF